MAAEAQDDQLDQIEVMQRGHLAQPFEVRRFLGENVLAGDGLERFRREAQVHRVAGLGLEINGEAYEDRVHRLDFTEAPASMRAVAALGEQHERFDVVMVDLPCGGQFVELFSHRIGSGSR